jgi:LysR family hydrogen peroxide-inducible transcriptional activator
MTLRQLEFLIGIADLGSISACAEYYGVTQPAVTNQIHLLEEELTVGLIVRGVRGATLTDIGQTTVLQAKKVLQEAKRITVTIEEAKKTITGTIVLGVSPLSPVSIHHFPRIYRPFHKAFPDLHIEVVEIEALHLADQVCNKRVGLALTPLPLFTTKALYEPLWAEELVVISNPEESLPDPVPIALLRDYDFVFMTPGYNLNLTVARLAQEAGFEPNNVAEASTINSLLGFVAAGIGVAIVPAETVMLEAQAGLVNISRLVPRAYRRLAMVFRSREDLTPAVEVFMHYVRSYSDDIPLNHLHYMKTLLDGSVAIQPE